VCVNLGYFIRLILIRRMNAERDDQHQKVIHVNCLIIQFSNRKH
jgi:hypothetical protein